MAALTELLEAEGIYTCEYDEGEKVRLGDSPFVSFVGDDETEMRALNLVWKHGYYPHRTERGRHLIREHMEQPDYTFWFDRDYAEFEWEEGSGMTQAEVRRVEYEVADLITDNGYDVIITEDGRKVRTEYVHRVLIEGTYDRVDDVETGRGAAELARQHGYPVLSFQKVWDGTDDPYWQIDIATKT